MPNQTKNYLLSFVIVAATALLLVKAGHLLGYMEQQGFIRLNFDFLYPQAAGEQNVVETYNDRTTTEAGYSWEEIPEPSAEEENKQKYLQMLSAEIDLKLEQMQQAEENLQQMMYHRQTDPATDTVSRLSELYAEMPEADAARIFETLDDETVILLLHRMDVRKASAILALLNSEKIKSVTAKMLAGATREAQ